MPASHWECGTFVQQAKQMDTVHKVLQTLNSPEIWDLREQMSFVLDGWYLLYLLLLMLDTNYILRGSAWVFFFFFFFFF
jgi:hypothetical protein